MAKFQIHREIARKQSLNLTKKIKQVHSLTLDLLHGQYVNPYHTQKIRSGQTKTNVLSAVSFQQTLIMRNFEKEIRFDY